MSRIALSCLVGSAILSFCVTGLFELNLIGAVIVGSVFGVGGQFIAFLIEDEEWN